MTVFNENRSKTSQIAAQNLDADEDLNYPLHGFKHLDKVGINEEHVRLAQRTTNDFESVLKLRDPTLPPPISKTGYEKYKRPSKLVKRTKGIFQGDDDSVSVVKHPCDLQLQNFKDLLRINPEITDYLKRKDDLGL